MWLLWSTSFSTVRIGYAIAERLVRDGAMVMVSSRKEGNVESAVERLRELAGERDRVQGLVCHVGKEAHRSRLLQEVSCLKVFL